MSRSKNTTKLPLAQEADLDFDEVAHVCGEVEHCTSACAPPARVLRGQIVTIARESKIGPGRVLVLVEQVVQAGERLYVTNTSAGVARWVARATVRSVPREAALALACRKKGEPGAASLSPRARATISSPRTTS